MKRYPGIRPFTTEDRHLFNGRDQEKRDLYRLIVLHDLVVLFGKSGIGKTSLLKAGVCPQLENRNIHPVFIRLNKTDQSPESQVYQTLKDQNFLPPNTKSNLSLWEYFKLFWYVDVGEVFSPVIVFDQFEELFTLYTPQERKEFINQLAAVTNGRIPTEVRENLRNEKKYNRESNNIDWESPSNIKFVFSIRSDFLYLLDELSEEIPAILRCRFHLKMLDKNNAVKAIETPANLDGNYDSPIFNYSKASIDTIIKELGKEENDHLSGQKKVSIPEIEAYQLQLLCQYIEEKVILENKETGFQVTPSFFGNADGVQNIIGDFYNRVLKKVPKKQRDQVEKMLGHGLLRNGRRIIMEGSVLIEEYQLSQKTLDLLHEERLIHQEPRKGYFYYEINHDTLIEPISSSYQLIADREKQEVYDREIKEEKRKRRKAMIIGGIGITLATLALIGFFIVLKQRNEIKIKEIEITQRLVQNQIESARTLKVDGKYREAIIQLDKTETYGEKLEPETLQTIQLLKTKWSKIDSLMIKIDISLKNKQYRSALDYLNKANQIDPDNSLKNRISDTKNQLETEIQNLIKEGKRLENIGNNKTLAKTIYKKALFMKSEDEKINKQIQDLIDNLKLN